MKHCNSFNSKVLETFKYEDFQEYKKLLDKELKTGNKPSIVFIETDKKLLEHRRVNNSAYYQLKAYLFKLGIPVQFINYNTIQKTDKYLHSILNSIGLQVYAKIGGVPWVLSTNKQIDKEIIIGIGHSWIKQNKYVKSDFERIVGITTFFSADGQYLLSNTCKDVPFEEYFEELLMNLRNSLNEIIQIQNWKEGSTIRLIFHIFKPIKNKELEVVSALVKEYTKYDIQCAFVTIKNHHPFILFDANESGIGNRYNNKVKGRYVPKRGENLILDNYSCLIQMKGAKQTKTSKQGASLPLLINIQVPENCDEELLKILFIDIKHVTQQIYHLTNFSWRSFFASETPVSMLYSNLIADTLSKLNYIEGWNSLSINVHMKDKKWFL